MKKRKYFGTDGIRGQVGFSNINPEFMIKLGWAFGRVLANGVRKTVVIGKDTRVSGYMLESALESGLSAAGVDVLLLGPMPTPAIAYLTQTLGAAAGVVISASHNSFEDNGIKFFSGDGMKLPDEIELLIEEKMEEKLTMVSPRVLGKATRVNDAPGRYIEFCKATIPSMTRLTGLKIAVDCAHGATYHVAPNVFRELGAEVFPININPDGFNINRHCGSTSPEHLQQHVLVNNADIGIALDGDGDRVILVNADGELINGDQILYIIARDRMQKGLLQGGVVGTLMSNYGLEKAIQELGLSFFRANVGDRYVLDALLKNNWRIGGENSGHIVCLDKTTTGDGIIAALQVLTIMVKQNKSLKELCEGIKIYPQSLINLNTSNAETLMQHDEVKLAVEKMNKMLGNNGRVLLRPSGTESKLRIMVEGIDEADVLHKAQDLYETISQIEKKLEKDKA